MSNTAYLQPSESAGARTQGPSSNWLPWTIAIAVAGVHAFVAFVLLDPDTLLSLDAAVKLLQSKSLVASGWTSLALPYPGGGLDPAHRYFPFLPPFVFRTGGEWHGIFPTSAALLNATVVGFGTPGVVLLSVLGSGLTMAAAAWLSPRASRAVIGAVLGLATCFWFYAALPWEHVPAAALSTLAFASAVRGGTPARMVCAGVLLGCAASLRDESLLLLPGLLWAAVRKGARPSTLGLALAACLLPVVLAGVIDSLVYGRPGAAHLRHAVDPLRWVGLSAPVELPQIPHIPLPGRYDIVMHEWLLGFRGATQSLLLVGVLSTLALVRRAEVCALGVLVVLCVALGQHVRDLYSLMRQPDLVAGLLRLSPFLIFAALPAAFTHQAASHRPTLLVTTVLFLTGMLLLVNTTGGASLGPRLLIPVLPLLVVAAWEGLDSYRVARHTRVEYRLIWLLGLALLLGSTVMQVGVAARAYVAFNRSERQAVRWLQQSSEPIVVDSTFTASVTEPVYTGRLVFLAADQQHASELALRLAAEGFGSLLLVSREPQQSLSFPPFQLADTRRTQRTVVQRWVR
jgi:hypothetical protein